MVTGPEFRLSLPVALVQNQVSENWHAQAMSGSNNGVQCSSKTNRGAAARVLCKQLVPDICFFFLFFFLYLHSAHVICTTGNDGRA